MKMCTIDVIQNFGAILPQHLQLHCLHYIKTMLHYGLCKKYHILQYQHSLLNTCNTIHLKTLYVHSNFLE